MNRQLKELRLKQNSLVLWFTGLPGAGKTTIAKELEKKLYSNHYFSIRIDGDTLRQGLCWDLQFSAQDRIENICRAAHLARLLVDNGVIAICALISPTHAMRKAAQQIVGRENFYEVFIKTPLEVCEERDPKGLYAKARKGQIKDFTGVSAPYEPPLSPDIYVETVKHTPEGCAELIYKKIKNLIKN